MSGTNGSPSKVDEPPPGGRPPEPNADPRSSEPGYAGRQLFAERSFALLWCGQLLSMIGVQCLLVAGITLISDIAHSPLAVLIPAICLMAPPVILGLVGGVIADRVNRKLVMVVSDLSRALIVLPILFVTSPEQIWILYGAAAGLAVAGAFFDPARNASLPTILPADSLIAANGLLRGSHVIALIIGPAIGGLAVELWQPSAVLFNSMMFVVSAVAVSLMRIPPNGRGASEVQRSTIWRDVKDGLAFVRRNRVLGRVLVVTAVATLGAGAVLLLAIPHLKTRLAASSLQYGMAISVLGLGSLVGCAVVTRVARGVATSTMVGGMLMLGGGAIVAFAHAPGYFVVLISAAVMGMCLVVARGTLDALTQKVAPDEIRGRVQSAVNILIVSSTAIAAGLSAGMGLVMETEIILVAGGATTAAAGLAAVLVLREAGEVLRPRTAPAS